MTDAEQKTGIVRNFVVGLPKACGVPEGLAEIFAEHNGKLFDWEIANANGRLNRENFKSYEDRVIHGFAWLAFANPDHAQYALDLMVFAAKSIDFNGKGISVEGLAEDRDMLEQDEAEHPEVAALLTVEQASILTAWD